MWMEVAATSETHDGVPTPLSDVHEDLPIALFRGYDRRAVRQLIARLDATYSDLIVEREQLLAELGRLQGLCEGLERSEQGLMAEVEKLTAALESSNQANKSLADQLQCGRSRWDGELARARADLQRDLDQAERELAGYRRREEVLTNVAASSRSRADAVMAEARGEAERLLRRARERDQKMLRNAQRELNRLESERLRLQHLAADFRRDLTDRLAATLGELNRPESNDTCQRGSADETGLAQPGGVECPRPADRSTDDTGDTLSSAGRDR